MKKKERDLRAVIVIFCLLSTVVLFMTKSRADASLNNSVDEMATGEHLSTGDVIMDDSTFFLTGNREDVLLNNNANENNVDEMATEEYLNNDNVITDDSTIFESN